MWKTLKKVHWRQDDFWEISLDDLEEWFWWNERLALSYLEPKFEDLSEEIKDRIQKSLKSNE